VARTSQVKVTLVCSGGGIDGFNSAGKGMSGGWIGHGLALLSACAKQAGYDVDLIDRRALRDWEHFREEVRHRAPDVVGFGILSVDFNPAMGGIELVKEINPKAITVVGGPHATLAPDEVLASPSVDHVVLGEGEITFVEMLRKFERGEVVERLIQGERPDLDELPYADRDAYLKEWRRAGYDYDSPEAPLSAETAPPFVTIIAGRGCRYNCSFCKPGEDILFGKGVRRRSVAHVMGELRELRDKYHFNTLMIHDDCLTEDRQWVSEFCDAYQAQGFAQPFWCQARVDHVVRHEDMIRRMSEVGLSGLFLGFESGSDRVLKFIRKGTSVAKNLEATRICRKYGIRIWANYMLGLPTETEAEIKETIAMLKEIDPDYYSPAFYTPYPGNDLYDYCMEHDLSLIKDHDGYSRNPTELKIKGHDPQFLRWALRESQRRKLGNRIRRGSGHFLRRYASPRKVISRLSRAVRAS
jgi:anaerobic magnesium-protoporphyrin IX monomethyl ester cyclase